MTDAVRIEFPSDTRYVAFARVAAASLVIDLDPSVDDVDDLRVAVDELVGLLIEAAEGRGTIRLEMAVNRDSISVTGVATHLDATPEPDDLAHRILESTVDRWDVDGASFSLHKRLGRD